MSVVQGAVIPAGGRMIRGRGNTHYTCENGCCEIRVEVHAKRGIAARVWLNGKLGTFATHAAELVMSGEAMNSKIRRRSCLNFRRTTKDVRVTEKAMQDVAAKFLALPRPDWGHPMFDYFARNER